MGYLTGGLGLALLLALFLLNQKDGKLDEVRAALAQEQANAQIAEDANATLVESLAACKTVNEQNAEQRRLMAQRALAAEARVIELRVELETISTTIEKTDDECRTLDAPLPAGFVDQLCIDAAANCRPD